MSSHRQLTDETMADLDAFEARFAEACGEVIAMARRLKPRMAAGDDAAAKELGRGSAILFRDAGATRDEAWSYLARVYSAVMEEPQA